MAISKIKKSQQTICNIKGLFALLHDSKKQLTMRYLGNRMKL